jgi:ADP-dependent NAD(P)H-hydrate dehydratase / NAD(P)H-hydrate epimerase
MPLPALLLRRKSNAHKNDFGHVLVMAGSPSMLGAACLSSLAAMRSGAGLVTAAVPRGLNLTLQEKISSVVMTMPVAQTKGMVFSLSAAEQILKVIGKFNAAAIGPGLGLDISTRKFVLKMVKECPVPMVVDADALNAIAGHTDTLLKAKGARILTPHPGEMQRLVGSCVGADLVSARKRVALKYARQWHSILVLKGHRTVVASPDGKVYVNTTGNAGMATAGCGDVLTGMIAAFLAQGLTPFEAARWGVRLHGEAGDRAARKCGKMGMIAMDVVERIKNVS